MKWTTTTTVLFWVIRNRSKFVNIIIIVVAVFGWLDRVCWSSSMPWLEVHRLLRFPVWWPKTDLKTKKKYRIRPKSLRPISISFSVYQRGERRGAGFGLSSQIIIVFLQQRAGAGVLCCAECHEAALSAFLVGEGQARAESSRPKWLW